MFTEPQVELRRQLLTFMKERRRVVLDHEGDWLQQLAKMMGVTTTNSQLRQAIKKLVFLGAIRCTHPQLDDADGAVSRKHILVFLKDVEL